MKLSLTSPISDPTIAFTLTIAFTALSQGVAAFFAELEAPVL